MYKGNEIQECETCRMKTGHAHKWNTVDVKWISNATCRNKLTQILNEKEA